MKYVALRNTRKALDYMHEARIAVIQSRRQTPECMDLVLSAARWTEDVYDALLFSR